MADESQICEALVDAIVAIVYPSGIGQPSVTGAPFKVYRGWPQANNLDADLAAHAVNISVIPRNGMFRNTTRYLPQDFDLPATPPSITASVSGTAVTFAGTISAGDMVGLGINRTGYSYVVQAGNTLNSVAAYFAATFGVTATGPSVTIPTTYPVTALTLAPGSSAREVRRSEQGFTVTVWAFDYPSRDAAASAIDEGLSDLFRLALPDGSVGERLRLAGAFTNDHAENANLYSRDLIYTVEYPTVKITTGPRALFVGADITRVIGAAVNYNPDIVSGQTYPAISLDGAGQAVLDGDHAEIFQGFDL